MPDRAVLRRALGRSPRGSGGGGSGHRRLPGERGPGVAASEVAEELGVTRERAVEDLTEVPGGALHGAPAEGRLPIE